MILITYLMHIYFCWFSFVIFTSSMLRAAPPEVFFRQKNDFSIFGRPILAILPILHQNHRFTSSELRGGAPAGFCCSPKTWLFNLLKSCLIKKILNIRCLTKYWITIWYLIKYCIKIWYLMKYLINIRYFIIYKYIN